MSAATPQRPNMTTQHSPSKPPSRRVLGDLAPKAINTPSSQTNTFASSEFTRAQSPLKQAHCSLAPAFGDKENFEGLSAYSKGKKRGIDEVDGAESAENLKMLARGRDETLSNTGMRLTAAAMSRHTVFSIQALTHHSATNKFKESNPIGLAYPGSPTERNTPSPSPEPMPESQKSTQSFSDFLNYDQCASQKSEQAVPAEPAPKSVPALVAVEEKSSRAEQLRTRLKFGLYKVKTNQVGKRDADIISRYETSVSRSSNALYASNSTAITSSIESIGSHKVPNITISSPQRKERPVFVKANLDPFRAIGKLGPAPVQFQIPQNDAVASSHMMDSFDASSSPPHVELPKSVSPGQLMSPVQQSTTFRSPTMTRIQLGEHDDEDILARDVTRHQRLQRLKEQAYLEGDLSRSNVKSSTA